jgi:hypothetical protein
MSTFRAIAALAAALNIAWATAASAADNRERPFGGPPPARSTEERPFGGPPPSARSIKSGRTCQTGPGQTCRLDKPRQVGAACECAGVQGKIIE